jgi:hypothetical protein
MGYSAWFRNVIMDDALARQQPLLKEMRASIPVKAGGEFEAQSAVAMPRKSADDVA